MRDMTQMKLNAGVSINTKDNYRKILGSEIVPIQNIKKRM
jgi:hypothetical protein